MDDFRTVAAWMMIAAGVICGGLGGLCTVAAAATAGQAVIIPLVFLVLGVAIAGTGVLLLVIDRA